ncbi:MAG: hypothetical protein V3V35_02690 [Dehalococcoidia bacterium]
MNVARTERFKRAYQALPLRERERVKKAVALMLEQGLRYPGLHAKRIKGTASIREARVSRGCRLTFQIDGDTIVLRNVGEHDATLKRP